MQSRSRTGFSLVELLTIIAILSILAAVLLPVFFTVRGKAQQTACLSNMSQIGKGFAQYLQDYDGFFPYAVDPVDRHGNIWRGEFGTNAPNLPWLHEALQPYVKSKTLFRCNADTGFEYADFSAALQNVYPSSFEKYGTSYYYHTALAAVKANESRLLTPAQINLMYDGSGIWHGTLFPPAQRYNVLYADYHAKNVSRSQIDEAWSTAF
ncbi:type II secretion system protein [bacterium]|nr:MAG: type II secretion system protein [bacterium]